MEHNGLDKNDGPWMRQRGSSTGECVTCALSPVKGWERWQCRRRLRRDISVMKHK